MFIDWHRVYVCIYGMVYAVTLGVLVGLLIMIGCYAYWNYIGHGAHEHKQEKENGYWFKRYGNVRDNHRLLAE